MIRLLPPYAAVCYSDRYTERWVRFRSPEAWRGRTCVHYRRVPYARLQPAGSETHIEVRAYWRKMLDDGGPIPPLVVSATPHGTYYVHDGNHRYCALAEYFGDYAQSFARVRVALVEPIPGYAFIWRWFEGYGTYVLEPSEIVEAKAFLDRANPLVSSHSQATGSIEQELALVAGISGA